jgi:ABC-2 type transport system ATP-binding protein
MTVLEYLRFAARVRNLDEPTFKKRARSVVEICGLAQSLTKEIRHLSHGYRQRVGLAQALIHDPPILILDEPTSDLDPNERSEFLNYLKQIGKDRTVLLSTHNLKEVEAACARAIIVSRGRVVADGPLDEIRAKSGRVRYVVSVQESTGETPYRGRGALPRQSEVEAALNGIKGVSKVTELPTDERAHAYELAGADSWDLRPEIFRLIADKGWVLLELHRDTQTLEDVFRQLTIGDEKRNRTLGPVKDDDKRASSDDEDDEDDEEDDDSDDDDADDADADDADDDDDDKKGKR